MHAGSRKRVDVAGRSGDRLRHHAAAAIEQRIGQVSGFAHDRREGDALQRLGLLAHNADEIAPNDLELDAIHVSYSFAAMMQPVACTFAVQPGRMMIVVSRSSMIDGPL